MLTLVVLKDATIVVPNACAAASAAASSPVFVFAQVSVLCGMLGLKDVTVSFRFISER